MLTATYRGVFLDQDKAYPHLQLRSYHGQSIRGVEENFVDYDNNGNDIFAANYEDINLFPPLELLSAPKANAEEVNSNEQASSLPEGNHRTADHSQPSPQGNQNLEYQVQTLVSKVQDVKQMYVL